MFSITYSEQVKIEVFCGLGLANVQMAKRLKQSPSTIYDELFRCQPYQTELVQANAEYKRTRCDRKPKAKLK